MRALTLTQPWATLVALGHKTWETRSWGTDHRGRLAIHAAKSYPFDARDFAQELRTEGLLNDAPLPCGVVLCLVDLVTVWPTARLTPGAPRAGEISALERRLGNYEWGRFAWRLANVDVLTEPIPARGALGLWTWIPPPAIADDHRGEQLPLLGGTKGPTT